MRKDLQRKLSVRMRIMNFVHFAKSTLPKAEFDLISRREF